MKVTGITWIVLLVVVGLIDWYLSDAHLPTLSQWIWRVEAAHHWFRIVVVASLITLLLHFLRS